jgi:hypothetical protein
MARKTDKKLMTSVSLLLAKPQVTGFGIARSNDSGHQLSVLAGHRSDSCGPPISLKLANSHEPAAEPFGYKTAGC